MKKILSIALVALLAASAFAGFTGSANVDFGFNLDTKEWGFANGTSLTVSGDLSTASVDQKAEGDIYAGIKASYTLGFGLEKQKSGFEVTDPTGMGLKFTGSISEAYITDGNWTLSILGANAATNYAISAIDKDSEGKFYDFGVPYVKAPGVAFSMAGYKASLGLWGKGSDEVKTSVTFETPAYELAEGFTLGAAANYAFQKDATATTANGVGASVKTAYENDTFSLAVASDIGYDIVAEKFGADVAAKFSVTPVVVDFYYATFAKTANDTTGIENLLSAQVTTDLTAFEVPLQLTVAGKDLINKQNLSAKVVAPIDPVTITVYGGYVIQDEDWNVGGSVAYTHDLFTAEAGVEVSKGVSLTANASISSTALVPGATLKLAWYDANEDMDLLNEKYGKIAASCSIAF